MTFFDHVILASVFLTSCSGLAEAQTKPVTEIKITMTVEHQARCAADGGCVLITRDQIEDIAFKAYSEGHRDGFDRGERTCARPA